MIFLLRIIFLALGGYIAAETFARLLQRLFMADAADGRTWFLAIYAALVCLGLAVMPTRTGEGG